MHRTQAPPENTLSEKTEPFSIRLTEQRATLNLELMHPTPLTEPAISAPAILIFEPAWQLEKDVKVRFSSQTF